MCFELPVSTFLMSNERNVQLCSIFIAAQNCVFVHLLTISRIYEFMLSSRLCTLEVHSTMVVSAH